MGRNLSGQTQPISVVIITGIVVSLVGVAYFWGVPLIQKRASMSEFTSMERFIQNIKEKVAEIARSGSGEIDIELQDTFVKLIPYKSPTGNNSLMLRFVLDQPLIFPNTTLYLGATSFEDINATGTYGEASPSVVKLSERVVGSQHEVTTEILYRELLKKTKPKKGYIIALCPARDDSCSSTITGNSRIRLSFDRNVVEPGAAANGGDLVITYINVDLA